MLRAVAMAARLDFRIDPPIDEAIAATRGEIARSAPARLIEEFYKLLRSGSSERAFQMLAERRLLEPIAHQLQVNAKPRLWQSLAALDAYRLRFDAIPPYQDDVNGWFGTAWVDRETGQFLRIEAFVPESYRTWSRFQEYLAGGRIQYLEDLL